MRFKNFKFDKFTYFLPGLKRWLLVLTLGIIFIILGIALLLELRPLTFVSSLIWNFVRGIATLIPAQISGPIILILGLIFVLFSIWSSIHKTLSANQNSGSNNLEHKSILKSLERAKKRGVGPKIVAIGGGTGLSSLLRGLKVYSENITSIVTVGDDGGSSGRLREELKVVPPGDLRNCIVALSDEEAVLTSLFQYRFQLGSLKGHNLGNLFLAALFDICENNISKATMLASRILRSRGKVLPSSSEAINLCAKMEDGTEICGESQIPKAKGKIAKIYSKKKIKVLQETFEAVKEAELIILGPGSLYTSIIPNLLSEDLVNAIYNSKAKVLYICNLVQDKETENYKLHDFIKSINNHTQKNIINTVLINEAKSFTASNLKGIPIEIDINNSLLKDIDIIIRKNLHSNSGKHNSLRLSRCIIQWFLQNKQGLP